MRQTWKAPRQSKSPDSSAAGSPAILIAVGLLSAAMLAFELTLIRLFAVAQFYHFAFMAISLALLGSGAAGSLLSVWPRLGERPARWAAGFALAVVLSYAVLNLLPFDSYAIAWDRRQVLYLLITFGGAATPFLFGGLVIGGLLAADARSLHRVYAVNLAGSALGCIIVLPLLAVLGGEGTLLASAALGLVAAGLFVLARCQAGLMTTAQLATFSVGVAALAVLAISRPEWVTLRLSPYKGLSQVLLAPGAQHTISAWNASVRVDVVESTSIHQFPGLSLNAHVPQPPLQAGLFLDGDNLSPVTALAPTDDLARELAAYVPEAVIHALRSEAHEMLIVEPSGGWSVLMALAGGVPSVTVVERRQLVIDLLRGPYASFTHGLYADPRMQVIALEGRTYLRRVNQLYDVILLALSDSFHPVTSGAYSLSEDYRYTVEAMGDYLDHLSPGGLLVLTRWLQTPPTESIRTLAVLEAALRARGVARPSDQIASFRSLRTITFVVGNEPLTNQDQATVREFVASRGYDLVWLPTISPDEVNVHNRLPEPADFLAFQALLADPEGFIRSYNYDVRPPTDDRPFFFHYFRWRQTPQVIAGIGQTWQPFGGSGYLVLVALLALVTLLAALAIFGPLMVVRRFSSSSTYARRERQPARAKSLALLYFFMLGIGFLFIEMPLAQQFILFLGHPITAMAAVLFAILLFSGLGSLTALHWRPAIALGALVALALAMPFALRGVFALALGWSLTARIAVAVVSLAPLGVVMGVPFARGATLVESLSPGLTPWVWAVNGSASVISGVLATMAAVSWGFSVVLWLGAAAYTVALLAIAPLNRDSRSLPSVKETPDER